LSASARIKDAVKLAARPLGYEIIKHRNVFREANIPSGAVIFDVGANEGQTISLARAAIHSPTIHAFEPTRTAFASLSRTLSGNKSVHLNQCALGPTPGTLEIKEGRDTKMSSLLEPADNGWDGQGWKDITERYAVPVRTVDDYCSECGIERIDLFKTDTQGYDLEVLKGAGRMLSERRIRHIFIEITFPEMYAGQATFEEVYSFLKQRGFKLSGAFNARDVDMNALFSQERESKGNPMTAPVL
jgi:FkbM family methyltransferase